MLAAILANILGIYAASRIVPGFVFRGDFLDLALSGALLGLMFLLLKPLIKILSFPLLLVTLGLFSLVINGFLLWILTLVTPSVTIAGLAAYFWATVIITIINLINHRLAR